MARVLSEMIEIKIPMQLLFFMTPHAITFSSPVSGLSENYQMYILETCLTYIQRIQENKHLYKMHVLMDEHYTFKQLNTSPEGTILNLQSSPINLMFRIFDSIFIWSCTKFNLQLRKTVYY